MLEAARKDGEELLRTLRTTSAGLTQAEAEERSRTTGPNEVAQERKQGWFVRLLKMTRNPLVILLTTLSAISFLAGDARAGTVMATSLALTATTVAIMAFGIWLPYSPLAPGLGFTHLPGLYWPILLLTLLRYLALTQVIKVWLLRKQWILNRPFGEGIALSHSERIFGNAETEPKSLGFDPTSIIRGSSYGFHGAAHRRERGL